MMEPIRVKRSRTKGWKMPDNTVYVGRNSRFGNPFKVGESYYIFREWHSKYSMHKKGERFVKITNPHQAVQEYIRRLHFMWHEGKLEEWIKELRGKNLACWCPLDRPCHADFLLILANDPKFEVHTEECHMEDYDI